ncbi:sensor histidine kinase [Butyrivibrio sp. AE3004]|uniref:sensor histidine kinase n=1 Tax=Butyrivibrio sp. AE3004 TaxID=1506994 RepID=UPI000691216D|nr:histidine kinase [Butyrivibrio sp. AE3004]
MTIEIQSLLALNATLILQILGLSAVVLADKYIRKKDRMILLENIILIFSVIIVTQIESFSQHDKSLYFLRLVTSIFCYVIRPVIIVLFIRLLSDNKRPWILVVLNTIIYFSAFFSGIAFKITKDNLFIRGPLGYSCHIICGILLIWHIYLTLKKYRSEKRRLNYIPITVTLIIILGAIADSVSNFDARISFLTVSVVTGSLFYYIWLHLRFVREHEKAIENERRIEIMMSQIQPHFMFNTLSTIQALCLTDPKKAFSTAEKFGTYLRNNIGSLDKNELVPFDKEFEHTRVYIEIETIRFPNIKVDYDIEEEDFELPALTLQPIVENAIRHGVRIRKNGSIWITVKRENNFNLICVQDNGKGFDLEAYEKSDEMHYGLKTIRDRVENLCNGELIIESEIDKGTTVTIKVPVRGEYK